MTAPLVLVDMDGVIDRDFASAEAVLKLPPPQIEPEPKGESGWARNRWEPSRWSLPNRVINWRVALALKPWAELDRVVVMTERPPRLREVTERTLADAGLAGVDIRYANSREHPAYEKRRIARDLAPALIVEDDREIARFLARSNYEVVLLDRRYNQGPVPEMSLHRIDEANLGHLLRLSFAVSV